MKSSRSIVLSCAVVAFSFVLAQSAWCIDVDVAEAPTNDLALTVSAIESAQQSLQLNIYELSSPEVADALMDRIQNGVQVQILEEGQPVGGMSAASKGIVSQLVDAMQSAGNGDFLHEMTSKAGGHRRFRYDHAKYVVIDGSALLIGSENYSPTGNPQPGSVGNRGWEVRIHDQALAQTFAQTFVSDSDLSNHDVMDMSSQDVSYAFGLTQKKHKRKTHPTKPVPAPFPPQGSNPGSAPQLPVQADSQALDATAVNSFMSPTTSLDGLQGLFNNATTSIDIQLMTFNQGWGKAGTQSPLLAALLAAAQRGVKIRVLLNDETVFNTNGRSSKPVNRLTIQTLQNAAAQGLPIQALVANVKAMGVDYIHNKGVLVDGNETLISSINWDENSVEKNRETAVVVSSPDVYNHYEALFEQDWEASGGSANADPAPANPYGPNDYAVLVNVPKSAPLSVPVLVGDKEIDSVVNCPSAVTVSVQIGDVSLQDGVDKSFKTLSNDAFSIEMNRDKTNKGCIFMTPGHTSTKRVLEIRKSYGGTTLFELEGYTADGKLYSIRARTDDAVQATQTLDAGLYDGSGPAHASLADAVLEVDAR